MLDDSNVSVILGLVSVDCLFYIQVEIFLILGVKSYFLLKLDILVIMVGDSEGCLPFLLQQTIF